MTSSKRASRGLSGIIAAAVSLATCLAVSAPAEAYSITQAGTSGGNPGGQAAYAITGLQAGDQFTLNVSRTIGADTLSATALVSIFAIGTAYTLIDVDLSNDSSGANRITHFGMAIEPDALLGFVSDRGGSGDTDALRGFGTSNFPGFQLVEFCATSGSNCAGGGAGGLLPGKDDQFRFTLLGFFSNDGTIDLGQFAFKFQGGADSYQLPGQPDVPNGQVPQPAALIVLGAGLLALTAVSMVRGMRHP
jgi:hypothetical protein